MSRWNVREWTIGLSAHIYGTLLVLYPSSFRRRYGREMVQVFRVACLQAAAHGSRGLVRFWFQAFADLAASGFAERLSDRRSQNGPHRPYVYVGALIVSLVAGYVHLRADADALSIALVLGGAYVFGLACPKGAWRLALIVGLGIPAALLVAHGVAAVPVAHRDADLPLPAPLLPAFIGAYTGAFMHRLLPRLVISSGSGRWQL
ncbi:MAG TPA: hypothetical protein VF221_03730 [Chloroflexota bacterium]